MTPTERRDALAEALLKHGANEGATWCKCGEWVNVTNEYPERIAQWNRHVADAIMPKVEEWLAEAWDLGWHAMGDETISPAATEINPYRRSTP